MTAHVPARSLETPPEGDHTGHDPNGTHSGTQPLRVFVEGHPAPQGSKTYVGNGGMRESSKRVKPWRAKVHTAVKTLADGRPPITGPVHATLVFVMPRPASTPKRRTPAAVKRPDLDKLTRAVLDAIGTAEAWGDDSQVTHLHAAKRLAHVDEEPGVWIELTALEV